MCIAYETVTSPHGGLPLLAPMSEVAGRMAVQAGAFLLEKPHGGSGILLGGVPGVARAGVAVGTIVAIGSAPMLAGVLGLVILGERPTLRWMIAGMAAATLAVARRASRLQARYVYHYAFVVLVGVVGFITWYLIARTL
mgnify:CR=1 FL=1